MDPNASFPAGFPVPTQSPQNQMAFYHNQNSIPQYAQSKTPQQPGQQQHSFGAMPLQPGGPSGAMMPQGFPQQSSGTQSPPRAPSSPPFPLISPAHLSPSEKLPGVKCTVRVRLEIGLKLSPWLLARRTCFFPCWNVAPPFAVINGASYCLILALVISAAAIRPSRP